MQAVICKIFIYGIKAPLFHNTAGKHRPSCRRNTILSQRKQISPLPQLYYCYDWNISHFAEKGWKQIQYNAWSEVEHMSPYLYLITFWYNENDDTSNLTKYEDPSPQQVISLLAVLVQTDLLFYYYKSTCFTSTKVLQNQCDPRGDVYVCSKHFVTSHFVNHIRFVIIYCTTHACTQARIQRKVLLVYAIWMRRERSSLTLREERERERERERESSLSLSR